MNQAIRDVLAQWIARRVPADAAAWLDKQRQRVAEGDFKALALGLGLIPRKLGKADLELTAQDLSAAASLRPGWDPSTWSVDQAARGLLVLEWPPGEAADDVATLDKLFAAGEVGELVALYQTLPLLPHPASHRARAAEGVRTNMRSVFTAVAHRNPYPSEQFDDDQFNQMVLKCLFIGVPLDPIVGLDQRANRPLATMLSDYAHERWAAKRTFSPELWRPVGAFADEATLNDLARALEDPDSLHQQAAALALHSAQTPAATAILARRPELAAQATAGQLQWAAIARGDSAS